MTRLTLSLAAIFAALAGTATAEPLAPAAGRSLRLGDLEGVAYYTAEPAGHRVVVTLAEPSGRPVRVEAVLAPDQAVTLSVPREPGAAPVSVVLRRSGDAVTVTDTAEPGRREAAARF
ncbi:hypothetical protein [Methylobacterium oryzihabitans]|uniref:Uncharacterized protein n=1 Tax=Methylobacterium oryzihabitans TaxID=2499852 RepID=A0A3S2VFC2_9HYPH|nr:hypothetical protein [Methylobacterium oryzihabitans]RVU21676.1 hypothetical protein EOE48_01090 [Methylobacterium oryzihabitans]